MLLIKFIVRLQQIFHMGYQAINIPQRFSPVNGLIDVRKGFIAKLDSKDIIFDKVKKAVYTCGPVLEGD